MNKIKEYKVSFVPFTDTQYDYIVEAKNDEEAYELGHNWLIEAIGRDASKDWECSDIVEVPRKREKGRPNAVPRWKSSKTKEEA